ncbi:MAG: hypothetical protein ABI763_10940 [Bacteroidota bacterium]
MRYRLVVGEKDFNATKTINFSSSWDAGSRKVSGELNEFGYFNCRPFKFDSNYGNSVITMIFDESYIFVTKGIDQPSFTYNQNSQ